jgi:hypothetical protein
VKHSSLLLTLCLALSVGCDKNKEESENPDGDNLAGVGPREDDPVDDLASEGEDEELFDEEAEGEDVELGDEKTAAAPKKKLPPRAKPVQKCKMVVVRDDGSTVDDAPATGKKKKKPKGKKQQVCKLWDPKPQVSASHGVVALVGEFRWGMSPKEVFKILNKDIEAEYDKRQKDAKTAEEQDANRQWRREQLAAAKSQHTKFTEASKHRWGVSLIQYEYADDQNEEMLFVRTGNGLRKFYFFKDGELWKIYYAYSTDVWPGKTYAQVVEEKFFKWFGPSPQEKVKVDPKSKLELLRYYEWTAMDNEKIRSFDMTSVHGVIGLAVVDGKAEERIGERLPNIGKEEGYSDVVNDVLGGSDVCYDKAGDIVECGKESEKKNKDIDLD